MTEEFDSDGVAYGYKDPNPPYKNQAKVIIRSHPDAPDGTVLRLSSYRPSDFPAGSAVLCRNTAPLVKLAYSLLQRDVPCRILGRDIGAQLAAIVKQMRASNLEEFREKLDKWYEREYSKAVAQDRSPERISDQFQCLVFFTMSLDEDSRSVASLLAKIDLMFGDSTTDFSKIVLLSTIHRAKGSEWRVVFILDPHLMPSRFAKQPWQLQQERNLQYVAITRSMDTLVYISSDRWKAEE